MERASGILSNLANANPLVFAMPSLQRAPEGLAGKALPVATGLAITARTIHEDAYRSSVRLALRGGITRREEFELAKIAQANGISPVRALEIRDQDERTSPEGTP